MKRGRTPLWLLRDLPALIGIVLSFWPLMIMVISDGRRAVAGLKMKPGVYQCLMQMLPVAEAMLRFALHRQAYRALGWNPRAIRIEHLDPVTSWSDFARRFEAYRVSMMDLHAVAAFFTNEHRRRHRIRTRVDANAVRVAHASTDALHVDTARRNHRRFSSSGDSRGRWRATSSSRDGGGGRRIAFNAQPRAPPAIPFFNSLQIPTSALPRG